MKRRGIITLDAVAGLIVMIALLAALGATAGQRSRAMSRLADTRAASRLAEKGLIDLQRGGEAPAGVTVTPLAGPEGQTAWVKVEATVNGRTAAVVGPGRLP